MRREERARMGPYSSITYIKVLLINPPAPQSRILLIYSPGFVKKAFLHTFGLKLATEIMAIHAKSSLY
jgi:hypothetical protein